jgi:hypothetical protein
MRDKYLTKDEIIDKYNSRGGVIDYFKTTGTVGGGLFVLLSLGQNVEGVFVGGGVGTLSYFFWDYVDKLNEKGKQKALKNLEKRAG